jgi:Ca2+-binding EF-hand superfamily protein
MQNIKRVKQLVLVKEKVEIINSEELQNIIDKLGLGHPDEVSSDILTLLKEIDFKELLVFFRKEKETCDRLSMPNSHKIGDGSAEHLVSKLKEATSEEDLKDLFISSKRGAPKDQTVQTTYTDLILSYLNTLVYR